MSTSTTSPPEKVKIAKGIIVRIEYEIRVKGGDVIEASSKAGPLEYKHGEGTLLPALEKRLEGLSTGESLDGEIPADEVLPPEDQLPTRKILRTELPKDAKVEVGDMFEAKTETGAPINLKVTEVTDEAITARMLPPLAGKDLAFKVKIIRVEDPATHHVQRVRSVPPPLPNEALKEKIELEPADD